MQASPTEVEQLRQRVADLEAALHQQLDNPPVDHYRRAYQLSPQVLWTADASGGLVEINLQGTAVLGLSREESLGSGWLKAVHKDDLTAVMEAWRQAASGDVYEAEYRLVAAGNRPRWLRATAHRDAQDAAGRWHGTTTDISARKDAELLLENTQQSFSAAFAEAPIGMVLLSPAGELLEINRAFWQMLGYDPDKLTGRSSAGVTHPDDIEKTRHFFRLLQQPHTHRAVLEKRYIHRQGHTIWTRASATMRRDALGNPMEVVAIVEDITSRKLVEIERERMDTVLRENEERLQLIFAQAPVGVCVLRGRDLVYELVNPHYREILPNRQLLGKALLDAVPEVNPALLAILYGVLDTGKPFAATEFLIPLDKNRDGIVEDCWFNFVYHPLLERGGGVSGIVAIAVDVSSHVRARVELQRVNRELEEFAYVSSHDLQEPLRMVNIYTQLLMRDLQPLISGQTVTYAQEVQRGVTRMERLLKDLLNFSRLVAASSPVEVAEAEADLNSSVHTAVETLRSRISETHATVSIGPLPIVSGDQAQLAQVFQNLISNALKYSQPGVPSHIEISSRSEGIEVIVEVRDNGIGFEQLHAERIFGLFKRLHKDEYPGTGLGLAICKRIVERYGGRIWAQSSPQHGATFSIAFKVPRGPEPTSGH